MDKLLAFLGLAKKAGKLAAGEVQAENAARGGKAFLLILAEDASANTVKKFTDLGRSRGIEVVSRYDKETLGQAVGSGPKAILAVKDRGFANGILQQLNRQ